MDIYDKARERLELAQQHYPFCSYCGEPMTIVARDGQLWIECGTVARPRPGLRRRLSASLHERHWVTEDVPTPLAA